MAHPLILYFRKHGRNAGQHCHVQAVSTGIGGVRVAIGWAVERIEQLDLSPQVRGQTLRWDNGRRTTSHTCDDSNGVYEGVAIGGDRYPGSRFMDHLLRYNDNPAVHVLVLLGEVGGTDEYQVCEALRSGRISKPLVAWCIGTCASIFPYEVQFGHAGALAGGVSETAVAKNKALAEAGALVPKTFIDFGTTIQTVYESLVKDGSLVPSPEPEPPKVPMDWSWAKRLGLVRKPANFISSISDDRGEELTYSGMAISEVFQKDLGVGGVVSLLWFRRQLPDYAAKFIEVSRVGPRPTSPAERSISFAARMLIITFLFFCR